MRRRTVGADNPKQEWMFLAKKMANGLAFSASRRMDCFARK